MFLFYEGPDNCGKGTQIEKIRKHLNNTGEVCHTLHYSGINSILKEQNKSLSEKMYIEMFRLLENTSSNIILDRSHLGESLYSPIYRQYSGDFVFDIEKSFESVCEQSYLIVFIDEPANLSNREDGHSQSSKDIALIEKEVNGFGRAFRKSIIRHKLLININGKDAEQVFCIIKEFLNKG